VTFRVLFVLRLPESVLVWQHLFPLLMYCFLWEHGSQLISA